MTLIYSSKLALRIVFKFLNEQGTVDRQGFLMPYVGVDVDRAYGLPETRSEASSRLQCKPGDERRWVNRLGKVNHERKS